MYYILYVVISKKEVFYQYFTKSFRRLDIKIYIEYLHIFLKRIYKSATQLCVPDTLYHYYIIRQKKREKLR